MHPAEPFRGHSLIDHRVVQIHCLPPAAASLIEAETKRQKPPIIKYVPSGALFIAHRPPGDASDERLVQ